MNTTSLVKFLDQHIYIAVQRGCGGPAASNSCTADLYYDATNQILGSVFPTCHIEALCFC